MKRQQVKSSVFKLPQPDTTRIIPMFVTPMHLLKPSSTKDLQLVPMLWRIKSETLTPPILIMLSRFKFCKPSIKDADSSCRKCLRYQCIHHAYHIKIGHGIKYIHQSLRYKLTERQYPASIRSRSSCPLITDNKPDGLTQLHLDTSIACVHAPTP